MTVLFALGAALAYGFSDFLGGLVSRRTSVWPVGMLACFGAFLGALVLAALTGGDPSDADLWWGVLAGAGSGIGTAFLYRGLSAGRMGVVAPVSAVGAVLVPLAAGLIAGERPGMLPWLGIVVAVPGIWLVSREVSDPEQPAGTATGLLDGAVAGLGFGVLFAALGQVPEASGYWPLVTCQAVSVLAVVVAALLLHGDPVPRRAIDFVGLLSGLLATVAVLCFLVATSHGLLSLAALITSLYPAFTVLLAVLVLHEHVHRAQAIGLALCATTVVLVGLG